MLRAKPNVAEPDDADLGSTLQDPSLKVCRGCLGIRFHAHHASALLAFKSAAAGAFRAICAVGWP
jgi:hypothetical protein